MSREVLGKPGLLQHKASRPELGLEPIGECKAKDNRLEPSGEVEKNPQPGQERIAGEPGGP